MRLAIYAVLMLVGCTREPRRAAPPATRAQVTVPATVPTSVPVAELVGAAACAACHRAIYDRWAASPHGRAMARPTEHSVLAPFAGAPVALPNGSVVPSRQADQWFMAMQSGAFRERRQVDLVIGSGRQHQLYVVAGDDGTYSLLPLIWSTQTKEWIPTSLYQRGGLDPKGAGYWGGFNMTGGCFSCHLSQQYRSTVGAPATRWVDLSINCESCHGPGREHVARRRARRTDEVYRDLRPLGSSEESRVCGQCHGFSLKPYQFPPAADGLPDIFVTSLVSDGLRPDGTQRLTSYQYPGHVLSECFRRGALTCKGCHEPHQLTARDFGGEPATGAHSNRQCTICHRDRIEAPAAVRHSRHAATVRCVDCHMAYSLIGDDQARRQRTSDHSISIPRPRETLELGTPNACNTCHRDRKPEWALKTLAGWGYRRATGVRPWVRAIALGRKRAPGATAALLPLLDESSAYLRASALDLLVIQPPDAGLVPRLARFAKGPDPQLRSIAIRALEHHDAAGRARWIALGLADSHPFVRMETFSMVKDVELLPPEAVARDLADTLAYKQPPTDGLVHLITVRRKRGEIAQALEVLQILERIALEREQRMLHVSEVRARFEQSLAGGR